MTGNGEVVSIEQLTAALERAEQIRAGLETSMQELRLLAEKIGGGVASGRRAVFEGLTIVNADGRPVLSIGSDEDGNGRIMLGDRCELPAVAIQAGDNGGLVVVFDSAGEAVAAVRAVGGYGELRTKGRD